MIGAKLASHLQRYPKVALRTRSQRRKILMKLRPSCVNCFSLRLAEGRCLASPAGGCWVGRILLQDLPGHLGSLHCLTGFFWKEADKHKTKPVIITLPLALSREFINLNSLPDHLSGIPGESKDTGLFWAILSKPHLQIVFLVRWLLSFSFAKPFLFLYIWKKPSTTVVIFFHVNYKYLESLSREWNKSRCFPVCWSSIIIPH